jgi:TPR repeat protein
MNAKKVTILLVFAILLIFSVVSRIFFNDFQDGWNAYAKKDYKTARELWLPLAEQGELRAQFFMGFMHDMGFGVPEDDKEAIKWYQLAAEQGDSRAQLFTGYMYDFGRGVLENDQEALKWYQLAAEQGYAEAEVNILKLKKKATSQALQVLMDDAELGIAKAQYTLGVMYANGQGVPQNYQESVKWYQLAAKSGHDQAKRNIYDLAVKNIPQALQALMDGVENGNAEAQFILATMYASGQGVSQDNKEAFKWYYRLAAEQGTALEEMEVDKFKRKNIPQELKFLTNDAESGIAEAQFNLGMLYTQGQGVPQDDQRAVKWYRLAAEQGNSKAQYTLGMMYSKGQGVLLSEQKAMKWFRLYIGRTVVPEQITIYNLAKKKVLSALKILKADAENGAVVAQYYLGMMLANGQGITRDYVLAHMWYNLSGLQGNEGAQAR